MAKPLHEMTDGELAEALLPLAAELGSRGREAVETAFARLEQEVSIVGPLASDADEFLSQTYDWIEDWVARESTPNEGEEG